MNTISMEQFLSFQGNVNVIDIRNIQSFNNNHIPGAINIPYEKLIIDPSKYLSFSKVYYLYCQKGISSKKIAFILSRMGYKVYSLEGGYEEWVMKQ
jgi:rhodanese-related sulfurtransferase